MNLPDGKPISIVSKVLRHVPRLHQIRGPKLFLDVFDVGRNYGVRHYLLGSSPVVLRKLQKSLSLEYPGCEIVGVESPPYRALTQNERAVQDKRISDARPDIIWVGLGTPKQDTEAGRLTQSTGITAIAVGAAFDFAAGEVREAPRWMTTLCLEWLFRLVSEPRRLWRRYLFGNIKFLQIAWRLFTNYETGGRGPR
ncbi:WecB/TagA/CpsF family glycosyltransferase [Pseudarthrobacter sp. H2]|uniref:WecB/TagA/CpsF family glycosyltransferase n=1 Tax=Pseudarthrobacter sp. H2 TaxID=3418415 RepID=UPI003CEC2D88